MVMNPAAMQETWIQSLGGEDPPRRAWKPTSVFLPVESHGQKSLADCRPWVHKESEMTQQLSTHTYTHIYIYRERGVGQGQEQT